MKVKKKVPFEFVLEELASLQPYTKPMFGCTSVYVDDRIVFILRDKPEPKKDRGVWVATTAEHHKSLRNDLPSMRSIALFGPGPTGWQVLPDSSPRFEDDVLKACQIVLKGDPRIGKVPKRKSVRKKEKPSSSKKLKSRPRKK